MRYADAQPDDRPAKPPSSTDADSSLAMRSLAEAAWIAILVRQAHMQPSILLRFSAGKPGERLFSPLTSVTSLRHAVGLEVYRVH